MRGIKGTQETGLAVQHARGIDGTPLCKTRARKWGSLFAQKQGEADCKRCQALVKKGFRVRYSDGSYFYRMSGIGPTFGTRREDAMVFADRYEAAKMFGTHFAFGDCELEESGA